MVLRTFCLYFMQAHVDWVLIVFGTQVIKKKRLDRPVFPDYLSVSYDYAATLFKTPCLHARQPYMKFEKPKCTVVRFSAGLPWMKFAKAKCTAMERQYCLTCKPNSFHNRLHVLFSFDCALFSFDYAFFKFRYVIISFDYALFLFDYVLFSFCHELFSFGYELLPFHYMMTHYVSLIHMMLCCILILLFSRPCTVFC